jgi:hypothetical protein
MAKVITVHKKRKQIKIVNYHSISSLCSILKIFLILVLRWILEIKAESMVNLIGVQQHDFEKSKSIATAGLGIQSLISRIVNSNGNESALMAKTDLNAAFDLVKIELLLKFLTIFGLPKDILRLIKYLVTE